MKLCRALYFSVFPIKNDKNEVFKDNRKKPKYYFNIAFFHYNYIEMKTTWSAYGF